MKIVHLCLCGPYSDGWNYQENMLALYHARAGHEVTVIASRWYFDGGVMKQKEAGCYVDLNGVRVVRLNMKPDRGIYFPFKRYSGLKDALEEASPDVLFVHGCQFPDIVVVVSFLKRHPQTVVYVDNHNDFSNGARNWISKNILHKIFWRRTAQKIEPYVRQFYGVLPARVDFLKEMYRLPEKKCSLLVMGADDEAIARAENVGSRDKIRERYHVEPNDFLVVTGGKIDGFKKQTLLLMQAVKEISSLPVKLIVFGSVSDEIRAQFDALTDGEKVQYAGWVEANDSYDYFSAADLVCFPGRHSVFWEQVAGMGIPLLCKDWKGTHHVDLNGNVRFLCRDSAEEIRSAIEEIAGDEALYCQMKEAAQAGRGVFSYASIAKRAIT